MKRRIAILFLSMFVVACASTGDGDAGAPQAAPQTGQALSSWHWTLTQAHYEYGGVIDDLFVPGGKAPQLDFGEREFHLGNMCNKVSGKVEMLPDQQMEFHSSSGPSFKQQTCTKAVLRQRGTLQSLLKGPVRYEVEWGKTKSVLRLTGQYGDVLVFAGRKTSVAKYGARSESIILEVAPWRWPCACEEENSGIFCLQVRELQLNEEGEAKGEPGPWKNFDPHTVILMSVLMVGGVCETREAGVEHLDQYIEGFTHKQGTRQMLRVNRFVLKTGPRTDEPCRTHWKKCLKPKEQHSHHRPAP